MDAQQYYVDLGGETVGPFSLEAIAKLHQAGSINDQTLYSTLGASEWFPVGHLRPQFPSPLKNKNLGGIGPWNKVAVAIALLVGICAGVFSFGLRQEAHQSGKLLAPHDVSVPPIPLTNSFIQDSGPHSAAPTVSNEEPNQVIRNWLSTSALFAFEPKPRSDGQRQLWYEPLVRGELPKEFGTVIIRPTTSSEKEQGAKYYIEDGSGRTLWYLKHLLKEPNKPSEMLAYLGFDPDSKSVFLRDNLPSLL